MVSVDIWSFTLGPFSKSSPPEPEPAKEADIVMDSAAPCAGEVLK